MTTPISDKIHHALSQIDNALLAQDIWLILQEQKFVGFLPHCTALVQQTSNHSSTTLPSTAPHCRLLCHHAHLTF